MDPALIEALGYVASFIILVSLTMKSIVRLRWINAAGSLLFVAFAVLTRSLPTVVMNIGIIAIDLFYVFRMARIRSDYRMVHAERNGARITSYNVCYTKLLRLFLWIVLIPATTAQVSRFQIVNAPGLYNTRLVGIVLAMGTDIMAIYIYLQFLESIPKSLDESAIIDGAGYFRVYWQIIMPLLKPATMTVLIIKSIGMYNDFYTPFLYMPKQSLQVISTALFKFKGPYGSHWEIICAGIMIAVIPTMAIFVALQKQIYSGLVQGAVKQ